MCAWRAADRRYQEHLFVCCLSFKISVSRVCQCDQCHTPSVQALLSVRSVPHSVCSSIAVSAISAILRLLKHCCQPPKANGTHKAVNIPTNCLQPLHFHCMTKEWCQCFTCPTAVALGNSHGVTSGQWVLLCTYSCPALPAL
jgi:hypothetical protein